MDNPTQHIESDAEYRAAASRAWYECAAVNPTDPLAVASQIEAAFKTLEEMVKWFGKYPSFVVSPDYIERCQESIKKAKAILAAAKKEG